MVIWPLATGVAPPPQVEIVGIVDIAAIFLQEPFAFHAVAFGEVVFRLRR